jgi:hypothetical protein
MSESKIDTKNVFTVDLGSLTLTDAQRHKINSAIQRAVAGEVAEISISQRLILIPVSSELKFPGRGPIINGIIARHITEPTLATVLE